MRGKHVSVAQIKSAALRHKILCVIMAIALVTLMIPNGLRAHAENEEATDSQTTEEQYVSDEEGSPDEALPVEESEGGETEEAVTDDNATVSFSLNTLPNDASGYWTYKGQTEHITSVPNVETGDILYLYSATYDADISICDSSWSTKYDIKWHEVDGSHASFKNWVLNGSAISGFVSITGDSVFSAGLEGWDVKPCNLTLTADEGGKLQKLEFPYGPTDWVDVSNPITLSYDAGTKYNTGSWDDENQIIINKPDGSFEFYRAIGTGEYEFTEWDHAVAPDTVMGENDSNTAYFEIPVETVKISGKVFEADGETPIPGVTVTFYYRDYNAEVTDVTDATGKYELDVPKETPGIWSFSKEGYLLDGWTELVGYDEPTENPDVKLAESVKISGTITDEDGDPLNYISVSFYPTGSEEPIDINYLTTPQKAFELNCEKGVGGVLEVLNLEQGGVTIYTHLFTWDEMNDDQIFNIEIPDLVYIVGYVEVADEANEGIGGATVIFNPYGGDSVGTLTNSYGYFAIAVPEGEAGYWTISADGYYPGSREGGPYESDAWENFSLEPANYVSLTINVEDHGILQTYDWDTYEWVTLDAPYTLNNLYEGAYYRTEVYDDQGFIYVYDDVTYDSWSFRVIGEKDPVTEKDLYVFDYWETTAESYIYPHVIEGEDTNTGYVKERVPRATFDIDVEPNYAWYTFLIDATSGDYITPGVPIDLTKGCYIWVDENNFLNIVDVDNYYYLIAVPSTIATGVVEFAGWFVDGEEVEFGDDPVLIEDDIDITAYFETTMYRVDLPIYSEVGGAWRHYETDEVVSSFMVPAGYYYEIGFWYDYDYDAYNWWLDIYDTDGWWWDSFYIQPDEDYYVTFHPRATDGYKQFDSNKEFPAAFALIDDVTITFDGGTEGAFYDWDDNPVESLDVTTGYTYEVYFDYWYEIYCIDLYDVSGDYVDTYYAYPDDDEAFRCIGINPDDEVGTITDDITFEALYEEIEWVTISFDGGELGAFYDWYSDEPVETLRVESGYSYEVTHEYGKTAVDLYDVSGDYDTSIYAWPNDDDTYRCSGIEPNEGGEITEPIEFTASFETYETATINFVANEGGQFYEYWSDEPVKQIEVPEECVYDAYASYSGNTYYIDIYENEDAYYNWEDPLYEYYVYADYGYKMLGMAPITDYDCAPVWDGMQFVASFEALDMVPLILLPLPVSGGNFYDYNTDEPMPTLYNVPDGAYYEVYTYFGYNYYIDIYESEEAYNDYESPILELYTEANEGYVNAGVLPYGEGVIDGIGTFTALFDPLETITFNTVGDGAFYDYYYDEPVESLEVPLGTTYDSYLYDDPIYGPYYVVDFSTGDSVYAWPEDGAECLGIDPDGSGIILSDTTFTATFQDIPDTRTIYFVDTELGYAGDILGYEIDKIEDVPNGARWYVQDDFILGEKVFVVEKGHLGDEDYYINWVYGISDFSYCTGWNVEPGSTHGIVSSDLYVTPEFKYVDLATIHFYAGEGGDICDLYTEVPVTFDKIPVGWNYEIGYDEGSILTDPYWYIDLYDADWAYTGYSYYAEPDSGYRCKEIHVDTNATTGTVEDGMIFHAVFEPIPGYLVIFDTEGNGTVRDWDTDEPVDYIYVPEGTYFDFDIFDNLRFYGPDSWGILPDFTVYADPAADSYFSHWDPYTEGYIHDDMRFEAVFSEFEYYTITLETDGNGTIYDWWTDTPIDYSTIEVPAGTYYYQWEDLFVSNILAFEDDLLYWGDFYPVADEGSTFLGWYPKGEGYVDGNMIFTAVFVPAQMCTVTLDTVGNGVIYDWWTDTPIDYLTIEVPAGAYYYQWEDYDWWTEQTIPNILAFETDYDYLGDFYPVAAEGSTFLGWYPNDEGTVDGDMTFTAYFTDNPVPGDTVDFYITPLDYDAHDFFSWTTLYDDGQVVEGIDVEAFADEDFITGDTYSVDATGILTINFAADGVEPSGTEYITPVAKDGYVFAGYVDADTLEPVVSGMEYMINAADGDINLLVAYEEAGLAATGDYAAAAVAGLAIIALISCAYVAYRRVKITK